MNAESAERMTVTASTADCAFALQRISSVSAAADNEFGGLRPWYEVLIRPDQRYFQGSPGAYIDKLYAERMPEATDSEVFGRASRWLSKRQEPTRLSVNIHPQSLIRPAFVDQLLAGQGEARARGHSLCVELVEFGECAERSLLARNAHRLRESGVLIALDDFGSRLNCFDLCAAGIVDLIKVDASVVRQIDADTYRQAIVKSIKTLAMGISANVIAEGVETLQELQSLKSLGVEFAQGYSIHRPELAEI